MEKNKNNFQVYALTTIDELGYTHWSKGLTIYIIKDGVTMKLDENEIQQLVKALPNTMGGTY
jgi:sulfur transfer complex TusBCD TusB component (DsrH family)